jgi:hypothetical protein
MTAGDAIGQLNELALILREILAHVRERSFAGDDLLVSTERLINERFGGMDRWMASHEESAEDAELAAAIHRVRREINAHVAWVRRAGRG